MFRGQGCDTLQCLENVQQYKKATKIIKNVLKSDQIVTTISLHFSPASAA